MNTVMATRTTFDGATVQFWTDGAVTVGHPMSNRLVARALPRSVVWAVAGDAAEVRGLIKAARKAHDMHVEGIVVQHRKDTFDRVTFRYGNDASFHLREMRGREGFVCEVQDAAGRFWVKAAYLECVDGK